MKQVHSRSEKNDLALRLRKIEGQVEAIEKMVEADANCADTLMHVISARRALKSLGEKVLTSQIHLCIESGTSRSMRRQNLRSLTILLERYVD